MAMRSELPSESTGLGLQNFNGLPIVGESIIAFANRRYVAKLPGRRIYVSDDRYSGEAYRPSRLDEDLSSIWLAHIEPGRLDKLIDKFSDPSLLILSKRAASFVYLLLALQHAEDIGDISTHVDKAAMDLRLDIPRDDTPEFEGNMYTILGDRKYRMEIGRRKLRELLREQKISPHIWAMRLEHAKIWLEEFNPEIVDQLRNMTENLSSEKRKKVLEPVYAMIAGIVA